MSTTCSWCPGGDSTIRFLEHPTVEHTLIDHQVDATGGDVDLDPVAVANDADKASRGSFANSGWATPDPEGPAEWVVDDVCRRLDECVVDRRDGASTVSRRGWLILRVLDERP